MCSEVKTTVTKALFEDYIGLQPCDWWDHEYDVVVICPNLNKVRKALCFQLVECIINSHALGQTIANAAGGIPLSEAVLGLECESMLGAVCDGQCYWPW